MGTKIISLKSNRMNRNTTFAIAFIYVFIKWIYLSSDNRGIFVFSLFPRKQIVIPLKIIKYQV